ncbi:MAG: hypothetical protein AB1451_05275 [Nitrospirota bacterium]
MAKHGRFMVLGLAVLGLALVATPAMAANLFTINETTTTGVAGSELFVPTFVSMADSTGIGGTFTTGGIYIPYMGTMTTCTSLIGSDNGNCSGWGSASIVAWANGIYYDPRFGTPFIPPSGDHHRTGYRMMMQPSFSAGQWNSGFASLAETFPFFPEVGRPGASGDIGLAMANASFESGLVGILAFLDGHGEPLTTGKFPRYWPHDREAWVDTLMVKYTAGGGTVGVDADAFSQSLRSATGFARNATMLRWRAMSNLDGAFSANPTGPSNGCGGSGWCEFYVTEDGAGNVHLFVVKGADGDTDTADAGAVEITQSTRLDSIGAVNNFGVLLTVKTLSNLAKLPFVIDDRLAQYSTEAGLPGDFDQQLLQQFRVVSGPNVHSEEGADPYAWVICGTRGTLYGEDDCADNDPDGNGIPNGAIDSAGNFFAIVYVPNGVYELGESPFTRFGRDLNPRRLGNTLYPQGYTDSLDPDTTQNAAAYVECTAPGAAQDTVHPTSTCESDPGADGAYGTSDDGTIYYKEALENGLRGWIRETNGHTFSFLGADTDGTHNGASPANFGLTQLVEQIEVTQGALLSCLGCSPHDLPVDQDTVTYTFNWPGLPAITPLPHPPATGTTVIPVLP